MLRFERRLRWAFAMPLCAVSTTGLIAARRPASLPLCALPAAVQWAQSHTTELPNSLSGLREYTAEYQRAIYAELSPEVRVRIWKEQLSPYLAGTNELTADQREIVRWVYDHLDEIVGSQVQSISPSEHVAQRAQLLRRIAGAFGQSSQPFSLISHSAPEQGPGPSLLAPAEACNCHLNETGGDASQCGSSRSSCTDPAEGCLPVPLNHCGTFLDETCNGVCS